MTEPHRSADCPGAPFDPSGTDGVACVCGCTDGIDVPGGVAARPWAEPLTTLVHAHRHTLAALARREGLSGADAVDVVQDAFTAWVARYADRPGVDARRTLVALTRNLARNRRRTHALARPHHADAADALPDAGDAADEALIRDEATRRLNHCVGRLADQQRAVVTLRLFDELPGADVATLLGLSPGHVAVLLHRARAALVRCMSDPRSDP